MARGLRQSTQRQRTQANPLNLGTFDELSLRLLKGTLGPEYEVGLNGYGGGTYNHWFQINLLRPAWIIAAKDGPRPQYINISFYDLNHAPIVGLNPFDKDSVADGTSLTTEQVYFPYLDTFMSAQSDLYNTYNRLRLDRGDDRYYPLPAGSYLLCVSSTRNENLDYAIGLVIEFTSEEILLALEDFSLYSQEDVVPTGVGNGFILEYGSEEFINTIHDHTLTDWKEAWSRQHQQTEKFPDIFIPLTNRP